MRALLLTLASLLLSSLLGCSSIAKLWSGTPTAKLSSIKVVALADANQGQATELDLVFSYQTDIKQTLPADAPSWFAQRAAVQAKYAGQLDVVSLEVPPGLVIATVQLPARHAKAVDVLVYANYVSPQGQHPLSLTDLKQVVLTLQQDQLAFSSTD